MTTLPSDQVAGMRGFIESAADILIALGENPTVDSTASALALYLALSAQGKRVALVCPNQTTVEMSHLVGVDKISSTLSGGSNGKNLVISFPYEEGSIEKVSYNIEGTDFNLVIEPRENYPIITPEMIRYTFSGGNNDTIITINASQLDALQSIFQNNQGTFSEKPIINIDINPQNTRYGKSNIIDPTASSLSELMTNLLSQLGYQMDADIATNLLAGITKGTQNFSSQNTSAATFESAAICLKNGAQKLEAAPNFSNYQFPSPAAGQFPKPQRPMTNKPVSSPSPFPRMQTSPQIPKMQQNMNQAPQQPLRKPYNPISQSPPSMQQQQRQQQPLSQVQREAPASNTQAQQKSDAPPDWLKPKIYKGSTIL